MKSRAVMFWGMALVGLLIVGAGSVWANQNKAFHGSVLNAPVPAPDFTLTDQHEASYRLSEQTGRAVLLFFGYTRCADVCPGVLARLKRVQSALGPQAEHLQVVLVTVDPQHDTPAVLRDYLAQFDPAFIGLTGAPEKVVDVFLNYGVYQQASANSSVYAIDHTDRVYAIDPQGRLRFTYTSDTAVEAITEDVVRLLRGN